MRGSQHKVSRDEKKQGDVAQSKEQNKSPETNLKEMDILRLPAKELKIFILKKKLSELKENTDAKREDKIKKMIHKYKSDYQHIEL